MAAMLFCLLFVVERRRLLVAAAFSLGVPLVTYLVFEHVLKSPLERGVLGF
jgi:uncharacterized membrane protein YjjB (DUF3815 family)